MHYLVITTVRNKKEALRLIKIILDMRLGANISLQKVETYYKDGKKMKKIAEIRILIETKKTTYKKLEDIILKNSSYELPSIMALQFSEGQKDYLKWLDTNVI